MPRGTVKWFDDNKGFGFIEHESGEDAFVHYSDIVLDGYKTLEEGLEVEFETKETDKGLAATGVKPSDHENQEDSQSSHDDSTNQDKQHDEVASFEEMELNEPILSGIRDADFSKPRPIQQKSMPYLLEGRDLIGTAPTGTGKTAAFLIPILQKLAKKPTGPPKALVLAPTHELAEQITVEARSLSGRIDFSTDSVYGGTDIWNEMERLREESTDLLVACPGRLLDHLGRGTVNLDEVEICVLDEADRMCDMGFLPDIKEILIRIPGNRQNVFFSATIPPKIESLANEMMEDPVSVNVGSQSPAETISHYVCEVKSNQKFKALRKILINNDTESVLVFCRTRKTVRSIAKKLRKLKFDACPLQGGMDPIARDTTLSGFRDRSFDILIATNVAARGLDVDHISHVINFDVPENPDVYTHRIGRTGRSGSLGSAYTLITPDDRGDIKDIENTIGARIERTPVPS